MTIFFCKAKLSRDVIDLPQNKSGWKNNRTNKHKNTRRKEGRDLIAFI